MKVVQFQVDRETFERIASGEQSNILLKQSTQMKSVLFKKRTKKIENPTAVKIIRPISRKGKKNHYMLVLVDRVSKRKRDDGEWFDFKLSKITYNSKTGYTW